MHRVPKPQRWRWLIAILRAGLLWVVLTAPAHARIAVLYPDVAAPYRAVFEQIISGIEASHGETVFARSFRDDDTPDSLQRWLREQGVDAAIFLGPQGYRLAHDSHWPIPVVVGATPFKPNGVAGVSLVTDPDVMLGYLRRMAPQVQRVHVVHAPEQRWLLARAEAAMRHHRIELLAREAADVKNRAQIYRDLMPQLDEQSAIWLLGDAGDDPALLRFLLESAWSRRFVLFSSTLAHVRNGVLFAAVPDNAAMGRQLAEQLRQIRNKAATEAVLPVSELRLGVNLRVASHLGVVLSADLRRDIVYVFPTP